MYIKFKSTIGYQYLVTSSNSKLIFLSKILDLNIMDEKNNAERVLSLQWADPIRARLVRVMWSLNTDGLYTKKKSIVWGSFFWNYLFHNFIT